MHINFLNICSESTSQLTEFLAMWPWDRGWENTFNYINMYHTHMGDLILHWNVYTCIRIFGTQFLLNRYPNKNILICWKTFFCDVLWILLVSYSLNIDPCMPPQPCDNTRDIRWISREAFLVYPLTLPNVCCCCCKMCLLALILYILCISPAILCSDI